MKKKAWPFETPINPQESSLVVPEQELRGTFSVGETHTPMPEPPVGPTKNSVESVDLFMDIPTKESHPVHVQFHDHSGLPLAEFFCDLASSVQEKVMGLQSYDGLSDSAGLVFEYPEPQDLVFHMGTVKFPIDIIFLDKEDCIKKIYKDIKPGTLGTFGCANAKNVLEIAGGLSDRIGIVPGYKASIIRDNKFFTNKTSSFNNFSKRFGIDKKVIIKYSMFNEDRMVFWNNFPILTMGVELNKKASTAPMISNFISTINHKYINDVFVFDFDGLIEASPNIEVYKTAEVSDSKASYIKLGGLAASIEKDDSGLDIMKTALISDVLSQKTDYSIISSLSKSFSKFLNHNKDCVEMFEKLNQSSKKKDSRIVIATKFGNPRLLKEIILSKYALHYSDTPTLEVVKVAKDSDVKDIISKVRSVCGNKDITFFSDSSIIKRSGNSIPPEVKQVASEVIDLLRSTEEINKNLIKNLEKNIEAYKNIKVTETDPMAKLNAIKSTKGQYQESMNRNKKLVLKLLEIIKKAATSLQSIRTPAIDKLIESIAKSIQSHKDGFDEIEGLSEKLESPDFENILAQKTDSFKKLTNDSQESCNNASDHLSEHILAEYLIS